MLYRERLLNATKTSRVCVGLDPVKEKFPTHLQDKNDSVAQFCEGIVKGTAKFAAAYKPNLAFFEALGHEGQDGLEHAIATIREYAPDAIIIGDGKRNDIGSTAERYAIAVFDVLGVDAVTVNPYLGSDGILPFSEREDKGVFLLALTSNPSATELQHLGGDNPLFLEVAKLAEQKWNSKNNMGLVVGATQGSDITRVREVAPNLPFLLPGIGAQGGDLEVAVNNSMGAGMPVGFINASRSIIYASSGEDFALKAGEEAEKMQKSIQELL